MASSTAQPMPETIEAYKALAQRDHDLIVEMKAAHQSELSKLQADNNKLKQQIVSQKIRAQKLVGMAAKWNE
jgi:basic membrane lipoprotein Med (substrate-binding protein (PBP1-ABC) superfamily)